MKMFAFIPVIALALALSGCAGVPAPPAEQSVGGQAPDQRAGGQESGANSGSVVSPEVSTRPEPPGPAIPGPTPAAALRPTSPPPAPAPPAAPASPVAPERYVSLNFDNADISVVIQTIAELLQMNYIVAPSVRGKVTIQTSEKLPVSSLLPVLEQILEVNNFMAVKSGTFYKIVPANQAKQESVETVPAEGTPVSTTGLVTKIVPLRFIGPGEVVKILTPFKTAGGIYQAQEPARLLFLTETPAKIPELLKIVEVLDVDTFASIQVELYPVRHAEVEGLARELTQIVSQIYTAAGRTRTLFRIVAVPQGNAVMVFSGEPGLAANVRDWIAKLDQPAREGTERIFVYPLSHASAESLAAVIEKVFRVDTSKAGQTRAATAQPAQPTPAAPRAAPGQPAAAATPQVAPTAGALAAPGGASVVVVADKDTNTLIIQTASWFYPAVEEVIRKLDVMPKQVLIEVLIAEVTLDDSNKYGISWALKGQGAVNLPGETLNLASSTALNATASASALTFSVAEANRVSAAISAYAKDSKLNILSAPHILATNNKEAKIDVGQEVPILKTQTTTTTTGSDATTTTPTDIEYRSTGIILTVTPHVNEGGFVTLDLQQEVSEAQANTLGGTDSPIIRKRTAKTTMVVKDDQTLVVGGLIQEKHDNSREGLPLLHKIPILGYLFGSKAASVTKTELVLLITPRIINSVEEGNRLTEQVKDRVLTIKKGVQEFPALEGKVAQ